MVDAPSLKTVEVRLDEGLSNLIHLKMSVYCGVFGTRSHPIIKCFEWERTLNIVSSSNILLWTGVGIAQYAMGPVMQVQKSGGSLVVCVVMAWGDGGNVE